MTASAQPEEFRSALFSVLLPQVDFDEFDVWDSRGGMRENCGDDLRLHDDGENARCVTLF